MKCQNCETEILTGGMTTTALFHKPHLPLTLCEDCKDLRVSDLATALVKKVSIFPPIISTQSDIKCPKCHKSQPIGKYWICHKCNTAFDTFETGAECPKCHQRFADTRCLICMKFSKFKDFKRVEEKMENRRVAEAYDEAFERTKVEPLAKSLHEVGVKFIEWNELPDDAKEGRRISARYLLGKYTIVPKS